jgi:hypothetical protein
MRNFLATFFADNLRFDFFSGASLTFVDAIISFQIP